MVAVQPNSQAGLPNFASACRVAKLRCIFEHRKPRHGFQWSLFLVPLKFSLVH